MSDRLTTKNGESVTIDSMIEALERTPDREELLRALEGLRQDRIKGALDQTVKAKQFDLYLVLSDFINDGEKAERTQETYQREVERFLSWLERKAIHVLQVRRADVNRFKEYLQGKYSSNTVRLTLASCSSFFAFLEAEEYLPRSSPFANIKYPKKQYKKAVKTDQGSPVPVMNQGEYRVIMETIRQKAREAGARASVVNSRQSARQLFPMIHMMAEYGLRIGDVLTVRLEEGDRFSVRAKGGQVRSFELRQETREYLEQYGYLKREPFRGIGLSTIQGAIRKLTGQLAKHGKIRHRYSAHDYRHFYAVKLYQETRDVYAVKEALGHSTTTVTEVYLSGLGAV